MKFSPQKKAKMRKVRFDRIKKEWKGVHYKNIDGELVIDKIAIGQNLHLLLKEINGYSIVKVNPNKVLRKLTPEEILKHKAVFAKAEKWFKRTKVTISDEGEITIKKKPKEKQVVLARIGIVQKTS